MAKSKEDSLDKIKQSILDDNICPELAKTATQLVFGDGNPDAEIVFIGEAPGKNEDLQGKPFVGAAGKFLNEMLETINLKREDVYITNIVKYRPPNNRDPLPDEKDAFLPYLQAQIEVIQPKVVIPLGRHSMNCFLPDLQISKVHGQPKRTTWKRFRSVGGYRVSELQGNGEQRMEAYQEYDDRVAQPVTQQIATSSAKLSSVSRKQSDATVVILPLFHPAAALYNGGMRQTLLDDFAKIPTILQKLDNEI
jgi:DNA polymerase